MKSDVISIDSKGNGFREAISQTGKTAMFTGLKKNESLELKLLTEETLSLVRSITGEIKADFWIECEGKAFELHLTTETALDKEKRRELIETSTSKKNEAATGFLGKLRDAFEDAMLSDADQPDMYLTEDVISDLPQGVLGQPDWDGYERSILQTVADQVKIGIKRGKVDVTICKNFA